MALGPASASPWASKASVYPEQAGLWGPGDQPTACDCSVSPPVALNFQTPGPEMDVYQGRFQDNGACGYVLKPAFLRDPNSTFNSRALAQGPWWTRKRLSVRVRLATGGTGACGPPSSLTTIPDPSLVPCLSSGHLRAAAAKSQQE